MTSADFPDDMLMRYADGELDAETAAAIERAMEGDDDLVARVGLFVETRAAVRAVLGPLLEEPVPPQLTAAVERMVAERKSAAGAPAEILPFPQQDRAARRWLLPLAASLAAVVGGLGGYWLAGGGQPAPPGLHIAGIDGPVLADALATVASGDEGRPVGDGRRFRAIATFRDSVQALCREFEVDDSADGSTVVSVACLSGSQWRVTFAVVAPGDSGGYAPASSTEALDAYLAAIEAGPPMAAGEEAQALGALRQNGRD